MSSPATGLGVAARAFYAPVGKHPVVPCPDCGLPADADFRDHGGQCLSDVRVAIPKSGIGIVHKHALLHAEFSSNQTRPDFAATGIKHTGSPYTAAETKGWIEPIGSEPSTDPATKRHRVTKYKSLIYRPRIAVEAARAERRTA